MRWRKMDLLTWGQNYKVVPYSMANASIGGSTCLI